MMTKKILFLLTFLLTTLGGGNSAWAAEYVLSGSTYLTSDPKTTWSFNNGLTISNSNDKGWGDSHGYIKFSSGVQYTISGIPSTQTITSVTFAGYVNGKEAAWTSSEDLYIKEFNGTTYSINTPSGNNFNTAYYSENIGSVTFSGLNITLGSFTFTPQGNQLDFIITINTEETTIDNVFNGTYPYTWQFDVVAAKWTKSISQIKDNTTDWRVVTESDTDKEARNVSTSITNSAIDICKGLSFAATAEHVCLDWTNCQLWMNGTLTIPSLKVGQTITFDSNDNVTGDSKVGSTTGKVFTVTTAGDVSFTIDTYIRSIAVTKNDLTGFELNSGDVLKYDNADYNSATTKIGINTLTFDYDAANSYLRLKLNMNENIVTGDVQTNTGSYFSITESSNTDVIDITTPGIGASRAADNRVYLAGVHVLKPGTSTLTFSFAGTDSYNATTCTGTITVNKIAQSIAYPNSIVEISYGGTINNTLDITSNPSGNTITYASSDTHVATVATDGTVTALNAGSCTITATLPGSDIYEEASSSYTLTVNATQPAPTITMTQNPGTDQATGIANGATVITTYGNTVTVTGECSVNGPTVKYSSSNTSVATVDANGVVTTKNGGTVTITVYTESYQGYPAASVSYTLTINATSFTLNFKPKAGYVNVGRTITPQMTLPTLQFDDILTITASSDEPAIANVPTNLLEHTGSTYPYLEINDGKINRFLPIITGVSEGTTTIRVQFTSHNYNSTEATFTVTVTADGTRNFSWADGSGTPTYTVYKGDYMKLPKITGNSNGNDSYSNGANLKYVYYIESQKDKVTWNKDSYKRYEGTPNIDIVDGETTGTLTEHAIVFFAKGQSSSGVPDTLFVFAKEVGTVTIRATDPQNSSLYCDATLNIIDKATTIDTDASSQISRMSFPYTWDFTGDFDMTDIAANSHYWERYDGHYSAGDGFFNVDWADIDSDNNYNERCFKHFIAGAPAGTRAGNYMPLFYGMEMSLQSSGYAPKIDRVSIRDYNSSNPGAARFVISGGTTQIRLPKVTTQPGSYRIYMKIRTTDKTVVEVVGGSKKYASNTDTSGYTDLLDKNSDAIIFFDVTDTSGDEAGSILNFDNTHIYWIACSTEAKNLSYFKHSNSHLTYAAAAYSYPEDLDLSKSNEVNGATAYYASSYIPDNDAQGAYSSEQEQQYAVVMKPLANLGTYVTAGTGMLLKYDDLSGIDVSQNDATIPFHMIANPRNVETYSAAETITGDVNYLVGTGANAQQIDGRGTDYTNFMMSAAYKYYTDITDASTAQGGYRFDRDWSFYPVMNSGEVEAQKSYLHIPANLYVDKNGKIVEMPSSSRRTAGESAEAPASKAALAIVFDDDLSNGQGTTGISTVATETTVDSDAWYTLQGVRVETPTKGGIYIHKGRKIVVK